MNKNKKLPLVEDLKSIIFDFEHGKYKINDFDIGHCTNVSVVFQNGKWHISLGAGSDSLTLIKIFNN